MNRLEIESLDELRKSMEGLTIFQLSNLVQSCDRVRKWAEVEYRVQGFLKDAKHVVKEAHGGHSATKLGKMPFEEVLRMFILNSIEVNFKYTGPHHG